MVLRKFLHNIIFLVIFNEFARETNLKNFWPDILAAGYPVNPKAG